MSISFLTRPTDSDDAAVVGRVWEALRTVRDPELDNDVVSLDFVASLEVDENRVAHVRLRLPT
jgi:metal-sulfur cluster biosynthetic enzyme